MIVGSAMAAVASVRGVGNSSRAPWLHNRVWSAVGWSVAAADLANALEFSADALGVALCCLVCGVARSDNGDGANVAGPD